MFFCSGGLAFFFAVEAGRGFCGGRARCEDVPRESAGKCGVPLLSHCGLCHGASEDILSGRFRESSCQASSDLVQPAMPMARAGVCAWPGSFPRTLKGPQPNMGSAA